MVRLIQSTVRLNFLLQELKLFTTIIFLFVASFSIGQSLSIISYDSIVIGDAWQSNAIYAHAAIQNNSAFDVDVHVKRIDSGYNALTDNNAICWGICYYPDVSESTMVITIETGSIDSLNFTGHVYPDKDGIPNSGNITYVFFNANKPSDSVIMTVNYQVDILSSVLDELGAKGVQLFPNPAKDFINLEFSENLTSQTNFKLFNTKGKLVFQERLTGLNKTRVIHLSNLKSGIYFYAITEDKRNIKTGRLIIQ